VYTRAPWTNFVEAMMVCRYGVRKPVDVSAN